MKEQQVISCVSRKVWHLIIRGLGKINAQCPTNCFYIFEKNPSKSYEFSKGILNVHILCTSY